MAGGPHAGIVPCSRCGAPADRTAEGIETDTYRCGACGHEFAIDWESAGPPEAPIPPGSWLTAAELTRAAGVSVWVVWYEDRFGWGPSRDPAVPVAVWASEMEARVHVRSLGGGPDIEAGHFDGYSARETTLLRAVETGAASAGRARALLRTGDDGSSLAKS